MTSVIYTDQTTHNGLFIRGLEGETQLREGDQVSNIKHDKQLNKNLKNNYNTTQTCTCTLCLGPPRSPAHG